MSVERPAPLPRKRLLAALLCLLLPVAAPGQAEEVLWQSGANLYIKLLKQDRSRREETPPNQHPVNLSANQLAAALESVQVWVGGGLFKRKELESLFSLQQARLLGQHLSAGLAQARPDQDIAFVLARTEKKYYVIQNTAYTGGRAFYQGDRLHIIIGDFNTAGDLAKERVYRSHGVSDVKQYFKHGRRAKPSNFKDSVVSRAGVELYREGDRERRDWLAIDLEQTAVAYLAEKAERQPQQETRVDAATQAETARQARERREMRLELARMRQELKALGNGGAGSTAQTAEERLTTLQALRDKELISDEEYRRKREQILGEL